MSFTPIDDTDIEVGKPWTRKLSNLVKTNLDDLNDRVTDFEHQNQNMGEMINIGIKAEPVNGLMNVSIVQETGEDYTPSSTGHVLLRWKNKQVGYRKYRQITTTPTIIIPSGATFGHRTSYAYRRQLIFVYAVEEDNGDVTIGLSGSDMLDDTNVHTTTTLDIDSDSIDVLYTQNEITTPTAIKCIGYFEMDGNEIDFSKAPNLVYCGVNYGNINKVQQMFSKTNGIGVIQSYNTYIDNISPNTKYSLYLFGSGGGGSYNITLGGKIIYSGSWGEFNIKLLVDGLSLGNLTLSISGNSYATIQDVNILEVI